MSSAAASQPRVAICAIAKNEAHYLEEWAVYHHLLGFAPIRVYDHESTDGSAAVLERLAASGLVEWRPWNVAADRKPQWDAYADGLEALRASADWIAFIDIDEFVVMPGSPTVQSFLEARPQLDALAINWKMFGSAGQARRTSGLVIERFDRCSERTFRGNRAVKTLARVSAIDVPRVHTCAFTAGVEYQTVTGERLAPGVGESTEVTHDQIRINHYFTRSREEWEEKAARGRGAKPADHPKKHRTLAEFERHDRNEEGEREILELVPRVQETIRALHAGEAPRVRAAAPR